MSVYTFATHEVISASPSQNTKFTLGNVMQAAGVGVFLYVGYEWVAPLAEETTDYRLIGKGMMWAIGLLSVTYALFIAAMYAGLTPGAACRRHADPAHRVRHTTSSARQAPSPSSA